MREGFAWGVATSAYQIEGAVAEDGRGESIWDRFAHTPGRITDGSTGDIACDHYHRWEADIGLMADLGVSAYRFSIAWPRIIPSGVGDVNDAGLAFYDRLVDGLLDAGITPYPTLYHWDLPQALEDRGGWRSRSAVDEFVSYADVVTARLGDRVRHWTTHNEPWVAAFIGHLDGGLAPGITDWRAALAAAHHLLLSHGRAVPAIRANVPGAEVGIVLDSRPARAAGDTPEDHAAQRHFDGFRNRWMFDPVFGKGYPPDMVAAYEAAGRFDPGLVLDGDLDEIAVPIDFLGLNFYTSYSIGEGSEESEDTGVTPGPDVPEGYSEMGWPITPHALTEYLERVKADYDPPSILITENGASFSDGPDENGVIDDQRRIAYLRDHIASVERAVDRGVPVDGYFVWSLMDNFEWGHGFTQRFGLVWTDYATLERIPKASFDWYRRRIAGG